MKFIDISSNTNKIKIDAIQCYEALQDAISKSRPYKGSMMWRNISEMDYLIHQTDKRQKSLGARTKETELLYNNFQERKSALSDRVKSLKNNQERNARLCKAVNANRVPRIVADISRRISDFPILSKKTLIVGTNALYAYEAAAAVYFEPDMMATSDVDVLLDTRKKISIASAEPQGFIGLLKSVDKSFEVMVGNRFRFRASNKDGFIVDLIQPAKKDIMFSSCSSMSDFPEDLIAVEMKGLAWLVSCPKFTSIGIDDQGFPVQLTVPDPRAFALHKSWLSTREDRMPAKKNRDLDQAKAVFELITDKLCFLKFSDKALRAVPFDLVVAACQFSR